MEKVEKIISKTLIKTIDGIEKKYKSTQKPKILTEHAINQENIPYNSNKKDNSQKTYYKNGLSENDLKT